MISRSLIELLEPRTLFSSTPPLHNSTTQPLSSASWQSAKPLPLAMGEISSAIIGSKLYVVGDGTARTLVYDLKRDRWRTTLARRPFQGDHSAAEAFNNKLYLLGGLGPSAGKVQIYDPSANTWTLGAGMPFSAGSFSTALIGKNIFVAGGIIGTSASNHNGASTTARAARYSPLTNTWKKLPRMPIAVNHAAASTDGTRLWIFGGRAGFNDVTNGFDFVQIYNANTGKWTSSTNSTIAPLPQPRGGMGKAVYANNNFYVMGGETRTGAGATQFNTYNRVDVYSPTTNSWTRAPDMPTARHGIFPLLYKSAIYVPAGGTRSMQPAFNTSTIFEILHLS